MIDVDQGISAAPQCNDPAARDQNVAIDPMAGLIPVNRHGALQHTKALMRDPARISAQMAREGEIFQERLISAEAREALAAFAERRQPDFSKTAG